MMVLRQVLEYMLGQRALLLYTYIQGFEVCVGGGRACVCVCKGLRLPFSLCTVH